MTMGTVARVGGGFFVCINTKPMVEWRECQRSSTTLSQNPVQARVRGARQAFDKAWAARKRPQEGRTWASVPVLAQMAKIPWPKSVEAPGGDSFHRGRHSHKMAAGLLSPRTTKQTGLSGSRARREGIALMGSLSDRQVCLFFECCLH